MKLHRERCVEFISQFNRLWGGGGEFRTLGFVPTEGKQLANRRGWGFNSVHARADRPGVLRATAKDLPGAPGPSLPVSRATEQSAGAGGTAPNSGQAQRPGKTTCARGTGGLERR